MGIYIDSTTKRKVLNIHDIDELGHNLKTYVETYFKNLNATDEDLIKLDKLDRIADALLQHKFDGLIEPDVVIDYSPKRFMKEIPF
jgi:hypothetical protein